MELQNPAVAALLAGFLLTASMVYPAHSARAADLPSRSSVGQVQVGSPLPGPTVVDRAFRAPLSEFGAGHRGVDLETTDGQTLLSPVSGSISYSGIVALKPELTITTNLGLRFTLEPACGSYPAGTEVALGWPIGFVCATGYVSHCEPQLCVHFSARNRNGYLSPLWLMGQQAPSHLVG